ncbi:MAG: hypothetical protein ACJ71J_10940, partial [Nitrososphaeraceae archaeon]
IYQYLPTGISIMNNIMNRAKNCQQITNKLATYNNDKIPQHYKNKELYGNCCCSKIRYANFASKWKREDIS